jgi:hypothetical protein
MPTSAWRWFDGEHARARLERCWREAPESIDQSNLAPFLASQMSDETTRQLVEASEAAGFLTRRNASDTLRKTVSDPIIVRSTGVMEDVFRQCIREMRIAIARL